MGLRFEKAGKEDIDLLTASRVTVLQAANRLSDDADMAEVEQESRRYYTTCFEMDTHAAYLVFDGARLVGTGGVSFYQVMPTYHNPTGRKAYLMNLYTDPDYRRRGIARKTLDLLVWEAKRRGITAISLEATEMGRPLYVSYGFRPMQDEMELSE